MLFEATLAFSATLVISLAVTPFIIKAATRLGIMDMPGEQKMHSGPVPRIGGMTVYVSMGLAAALAILLNGRIRLSFSQNSQFWMSTGVAATLIFLVGLYDDIKHASIWLRFSIQVLAALITILIGGVTIGAVGIPLDGLRSTGWFEVPLTILWIVGVTNAFNLIDGLDGLAGGIGFISTAAVFAIAVMTSGSFMVMIVSAALCGALAGFLEYNRHPAKIFLGDCGSMLLGYSLSVLAILGRTKKTTALAVLVPVLIVGVPVLDTISSMVRRLAERLSAEGKFKPAFLMSMFKGDKGHIHHVLIRTGHTQGLSVIILYGLSLVLAFFALIATLMNQERVGFVLVLFGIGGFFGLRHGWPRFMGKNGKNGLDKRGPIS